MSGVRRRWQHGSAAVELAVLMSASLVMMPAIALFAKVFYQYSVMKEATQDAAAYMASLSRPALLDSAERARASAIAGRMVDLAAEGASMDGTTTVQAALVLCDRAPCIDEMPLVMDVVVTFSIDNTMFDALTGQWTSDRKKWRVIARSTVPLTK